MALADRVAKAATPLLQPGETIEVATVAAVGRVPVKQQIATAAVTAAVTGLLTAGTATAVLYVNKRPIVLTNRRLLILDANELTGRPRTKLLGSLSREGLRAQHQRALLWLTYNLIDNMGRPILRLRFPVPNRKPGRRIAESLGLMGSV